MLPDFRKSNAFWKVSMLRPFVLVRSTVNEDEFGALVEY